MKKIAVQLILAAAFAAAGAACWVEASLTHRVEQAYRRLATLHYDEDDGVGEARSWLTPLRLPIPSLEQEVRTRNATAAYWRLDASALAPGDADAAAQPAAMFVAANASFRASQQQTTDRGAAVAALDGVIQSYARVLRADPGNGDAAYNYEYAARIRDAVARTGPVKRGQIRDEPTIASADLPVGPTIHGRPGGPPPDVPGRQFKTVTPKQQEERTTDPDANAVIRRKG